ncbi:MAG: sugar ABC transporter permease [Pseudomonadota bacterium]
MPTSRHTAFLLILPAALVLALLTLYPLGRGLALSFFATDYGFEGATYVGTENYTDLLGDRFFRRAMQNTVQFTLMATVSEVALGLALALLVNRRMPGRGVVIPLLIAPFVLSTMVVTAIWSAWFHYDFGYLNNLLRVFGLEGVPWLFDPDIALLSLVLVDLWQTAPLTFLILLAGLQAIDRELYEAAWMDGAGPWRILLTITLPLLIPHILLATLLRSIESFKIFDKVFALTGGGPGHATETLSMFLYREGFRFFEIGAASATAMIMVVIAGLLAAVYAWSIMRSARRD